KNVDELVTAGIWVVLDDGWEIRNYLEFNPSAATVKKERAKNRERMRKMRDRQSSDGERAGARDAERSGARDGALPSLALPLPLKPNELSALTSYEGGHGDESLKKLARATRITNPIDSDKLIRTVRSHKSTEADIGYAIEAATG